jgi:hypothetical protein
MSRAVAAVEQRHFQLVLVENTNVEDSSKQANCVIAKESICQFRKRFIAPIGLAFDSAPCQLLKHLFSIHDVTVEEYDNVG